MVRKLFLTIEYPLTFVTEKLRNKYTYRPMDESVWLRDLTHYCVLSEGGINYKFRIGIKNQVQNGLYIKRARTINSRSISDERMNYAFCT